MGCRVAPALRIFQAALGALLYAVSPLASAHTFAQVYTLPVPFWLYAWTAAAVLIVSFVIAGLFLTGQPSADGRKPEPAGYPHRIPPRLLRTLQALSLGGLLLSMLTGFLGTRQVLLNFNMTFFWIVFVLGFTYFTALAGNLYALLNPWRVITDGLSQVLPAYGRGRFRYPAAAGYAPALLLYAGFIWLELFGRMTPFSLSSWLAAYTGLNLLAVALVGTEAWFRYGEFFSVILRLVARLAPIDFEQLPSGATGRFRLRLPLSGLLGRPADRRSLVVFVLFMLSATAFDGLHEARPWVALYWNTLYQDVFSIWLGENPFVAFPALRNGYRWWQTLWLLASPLVYLAAYLGTIEAVRRLTGCRFDRWTLAHRFLHSLLPIVLVYNVTHYYTLIQTQGIRIIALVSDPFGLGWNLFGTAEWLRGAIVPDTTVVWHLQVALLLAGHVASVVVAHLEALRIFPDRRTATLSQLPMLALMVTFTVFGLWILSLPLDTGGYG